MAYLTKTKRAALDYFNTHEPNLDGRFFNVAKLSFDYGTIKELAIEGYIKYADAQETVIYVLDKGRNYRENARAERREYWRDKFITFAFGFVSGVLLSLIAAVIGVLIQRMPL